jgi:hypothetical protein
MIVESNIRYNNTPRALTARANEKKGKHVLTVIVTRVKQRHINFVEHEKREPDEITASHASTTRLTSDDLEKIMNGYQKHL